MIARLAVLIGIWVGSALPASAVVDITEVTTPGGRSAWLVEETSIPFVALEIRFLGGTSLDVPEARGATYLMTGLLEEGAGDLDARQFAEARDDLAASIGFDATDDYLSISARFLSDTTDEAVQLLRTALADPRFDKEALERVRAQILAGLRSDIEDPDAIAAETFARMTYGDHPYATKGEGTLETVATLGREDLVTAHARTMAQDRAYIAAAGDISPEKLAEIVDILLSDLPETGAPIPGDAALSLDGDVTVVEFGTPQSVIQFAQMGLSRDDPDFFPAYVLNQVVGAGGFGSRLMTEVREKRGLTYGIYAYLIEKEHADLFVGRASTANERAAESVEVIRSVWANVAENGITQEELDQAKTYLTGAFPLRFDGNDQIASILVNMLMDEMPIDYISNRNSLVEAVTLNDVNRVAAELVDPDALTFIVVGQPEGLSASN